MRFEVHEEIVNPVTRDIQEMFTHLTTEMRTISSRLSNLERSALKAGTAEINNDVAEIEF